MSLAGYLNLHCHPERRGRQPSEVEEPALSEVERTPSR